MDPLDIQRSVRRNADEYHSTLKDLERWEEEASKRDEALSKGELKMTKSDRPVPPPRGQTSVRSAPAAVPAASAEPSPPAVASSSGSTPAAAASKAPTKAKAPEKRAPAGPFEAAKDQGNDFFNKGDFANALGHYDRCVSVEPTNPVGYGNRAMALLKLGRYQACVDDCNRALALQPGWVKVLFRRATARLHLGQVAAAVEDLEAAASVEPQNAAVQSELKTARRRLEEERAREAAAQAERAKSQPRRTLVVQEVDDDDEDDGDDLDKVADDSAAKRKNELVSVMTAEPAAAAHPNRPSPTAGAQARPARSPANAAPAGATAASSPAPSQPAQAHGAPVSASQFEMAYRDLKRSPPEFGRYLLQIPPGSVQDFLATALDGELLADVFTAARAVLSAETAPRLAAFLGALAGAPRLSLAVMMMDSLKDVEAVMSELKSHGVDTAALNRAYHS